MNTTETLPGRDRPGQTFSEHISLLMTKADRLPVLGIAALDAQEAGREQVTESYVLREAIRRGVASMLDELPPEQRAQVDRLGTEAYAAIPPRQPRRRRAD